MPKRPQTSRPASTTAAVLERDRLVPLPEVRARLGNLSRQHVWEMTREGTLPPPVHVGRRIFWSDVELEAWIARHKAARSRR